MRLLKCLMSRVVLFDKIKWISDNKSFECFQRYLTGTKAKYVDFAAISSKAVSICISVSLGSTISLFVFIIYINAIHRASNHLNAISYGDDTNSTSLLQHSVSSSVPIADNCIGCVSEEIHPRLGNRDHSRYGLSQWETTLHCNGVSHWLSPYKDW